MRKRILAEEQKIEQGQFLENSYLSIARDNYLWNAPLEKFITEVCRSVCEHLDVGRASLWKLNPEQDELTQIGLHEENESDFPIGRKINKKDKPIYFSALAQNNIIAANDINDSHTIECVESYLTPLNIGATLDACFYKAGRLGGVLCAEHIGGERFWTEAEIRYLGTMADLIAQRMLHDKLNKQNAQVNQMNVFHQAMINHSNYCIFTIDHLGKIQTLNEAALQLLDYKDSELLDQDLCGKVIPLSSTTKLANQMSEELGIEISPGFEVLFTKLGSGDASDVECYLRKKDGAEVPVSLNISVLRGSDNQLQGYLCTATDISQRIETLKQLDKEKQRYRFIFESASDCMLILRAGLVIDCNHACLELFQCTRDEFIEGLNKDGAFYIGSKYHLKFAPVYQPNGKRSLDILIEEFNSLNEGNSTHFNWVAQRLDGTQIETEVTLSKIILDDSQHALVALRDVSRRNTSERDLTDSREEIVQHVSDLEKINQLSNNLHAINSEQEVFSASADLIFSTKNNTRVLIFKAEINTENKKRFSLVEHRGCSPNVENFFKNIPKELFAGFIGIASGDIHVSRDCASDEKFDPELRSYLTDIDCKSMLVTPLKYQDQLLGLIVITYDNSAAVNSRSLSVLDAISKSVSLALINAKQHSKLHYMAHHDSLTKLGNREYFHNNFKVELLSGKHTSATLFLLDLDRFKEINDTLGHFAGDKILQMIGPRLEEALAKGNISCQISRLGGDEFTIMTYGLNTDKAAKLAVNLVIDCLRAPFTVNEMQLEIDASIGIAMYPRDGADSHSLLRSADVAMYQAKSQGIGYSFYDNSKDVHSIERLSIMSEIGGSIKNDRLFLHYQPKIDIKTNKVVGFEGLVRWDHPRLGAISPGMFIPLIEKTNFIYDLTEKVLHEALKQQQAWRSEGHDYTVAINLSARNLNDNRIAELLPRLLTQYDTPPEMLECEITETAFMHDTDKSLKHINAIAELGVHLSIDDFGTGYSSLSYLRDLPIQKLKLDRDFIMGMLTNAGGLHIVETIITLSRNLGLTVIAEGVEDQATMDKLSSLQCHQAQGYYICRPNTWDNIDLWLKNREQ